MQKQTKNETIDANGSTVYQYAVVCIMIVFIIYYDRFRRSAMTAPDTVTSFRSEAEFIIEECLDFFRSTETYNLPFKKKKTIIDITISYRFTIQSHNPFHQLSYLYLSSFFFVIRERSSKTARFAR